MPRHDDQFDGVWPSLWPIPGADHTGPDESLGALVPWTSVMLLFLHVDFSQILGHTYSLLHAKHVFSHGSVPPDLTMLDNISQILQHNAQLSAD